MKIEDWVSIFFGGGGIITLITVLITKQKNKHEKKFDLIDRLMAEINRLDTDVGELRSLLADADLTLNDARTQLNEERERNAKLNILVIRLESTIENLKNQVIKLGGKVDERVDE